MGPDPFFEGRILQCLDPYGFAFVSEQFHARDSLIEIHYPAAPRSCSVRGNARELTGNSRMASVSSQARMIFDLRDVNPSAYGKGLAAREGVHVRQLQRGFAVELQCSVSLPRVFAQRDARF